MIYISRLRIRNFKSFKLVNIELPKTFLCLAGPNGSGKSNFGDSIRFVLGEISLKSLRAKKVRDLIHSGAKTAEVTLNFDGDAQIEVKRVIREDGKILYRLNGKKTTRNAILDVVRKYNLDESGRNIIAQGEVSRIIHMGGKERRTIIDSVAGISDFESKKKEALSELETVENRIKDASLVLGERQAFLAELGRERESAIKYLDAKKKLNSSKGTLLKTELNRLDKDLQGVAQLDEKLAFNIKSKETDLAEIEKKISDIESKRYQVSRELQEKQQTSSLVRKIEELKASVGSKSQMSQEKEQNLKKKDEEFESLEKEIEIAAHEIKDLDLRMRGAKDELKLLEAAAGAFPSDVRTSELDLLRKTIEQTTAFLQEIREKTAVLRTEMDSGQQIISMKKEEIQRMGAPEETEEDEPKKEMDSLRLRASNLAQEIDDSFKRTKEINTEIAELDRKMLELKEAASIHKVRASPHLTNPALAFISSVRTKDGLGIHGTVAELIQFDPKFAHAVEACGGARLLYVVVDDVDVATKMIDRLKKAKAGRATFIPVADVKTNQIKEMNGFSSVLEVVNYPVHLRRAMEYVFGDTILVDSIADAKRMGLGKNRMVTLEGEIFERTGIVSGGRNESSILSNNQLQKIESELSAVKSAKDSMIQELYAIRESESASRAKKSETEISIRTIEIEMRQKTEQLERQKESIARKKSMENEIVQLENNSKLKSKELLQLQSEIQSTQMKIGEMTGRAELASKKLESESEEQDRKKAELLSKLSSLRATQEGMIKEMEIRKRDLREKESRCKEIEKTRKEDSARINELKRQVVGEKEEVARLEEKVSGFSKEIEQFFERIKNYEKELQEMGKQRGEKRIEFDKLNRDLGQLAVRKATVATRLEDVRAEFESYREFEFLEGVKKDDLIRMISEAESIISSMPSVNTAAIEMYDKKKAEIEGVEGKISTLGEERRAILEMIAEIEQHKNDAFFKTFYSVSDNFVKMFSYLNIGDGFLYMDKPNEPFESGLYIKIKRGNKEHSIDSLSGGENSLVALMFIFALQFFKPAPFYILDEVDAALDKENSKNLAQLISRMASDTQFILVSHNDIVMSTADSVLGVAKAGGVSKIVGVKLEQKNAG